MKTSLIDSIGETTLVGLGAFAFIVVSPVLIPAFLIGLLIKAVRRWRRYRW